MDGVVNFLKPALMTSHDVISFFRKLTGIKKIGHVGTLDPMAAGVLPVCIGKATRLIEYMDGDKAYRAVLKLGTDSETGDIWGEKFETTHVPEALSFNDVKGCLESFKGCSNQDVPAYSAQKYKGKKLYDYARSGEDIPVKKKLVNINKIIVIDYDDEQNEVKFDVECSKGTYIRSICTAAGKQLGTSGTMSFLLRTRAGGLKISDSVTMEEVKKEYNLRGDIKKLLLSPEILVSGLDKAVLDEEEARRFANGISVEKDAVEHSVYAVYKSMNGQENFIGTGIGRENRLKPQKIIYPER